MTRNFHYGDTTVKRTQGAEHETNASAVRAISALTGFQSKMIVLLEGSLSCGWYDGIAFNVMGRGFTIDLNSGDWQMAPEYDF